jgi:hypothetical protein
MSAIKSVICCAGESSVTVWLHALLLLQQSVACQVRVMLWEICEQSLPLATVLRTVTVTLLPQQASKRVGVSKCQGRPHGTLLLAAHVSTGGVVSATVTVWLHVLLLLWQSVACQVRVKICGQTPLATVLKTLMVTLAPQAASMAVGGSKLQGGGTHSSL